MSMNKKEYPPENKISPSGWTTPMDVLGFDPPPREEAPENCIGAWDTSWERTIPKWVGNRFAMLVDGKWTTGQADLFGGNTAPTESWPRRVVMSEDGVVIDVKPWPTRPNNTVVNIPTPVAAHSAPNKNGNTKNGPKSLMEAAVTNYGNRNNWPTPKASGQEDPETLIERKGIDAAEKHNLTAAVKMSLDPRYNGERTPADAVGKLPTPKANGNRNSRGAIMGGSAKHPSKSDLALEQAVECLEGDLPRELNDASELPKRFRELFPTPTSSDQYNPNMKDDHDIKKGNLRGTVLQNGGKPLMEIHPTPKTSDQHNAHMKDDHDIKKGNLRGTVLQNEGQPLFPTPTHQNNSIYSEHNAEERNSMGLASVAKIFPTPTSTEKAGHNPETGKGGGLARHVKDELGLLPTPRAGKTSSENKETWDKRQANGAVSMPPLALAAKLLGPAIEGKIGWAGRPDGRTNWPTPAAHEARLGYQDRSKGKKGSQESLTTVVINSELVNSALAKKAGGDEPVYPTPRGGSGGVGMCGGTGAREKLQDLKDEGVITEEERKSMQNGRGGQLSADWVEPLMGYRLGTTRIEPELEEWFKIDQKRLKATDLKKLHEAEMVEDED